MNVMKLNIVPYVIKGWYFNNNPNIAQPFSISSAAGFKDYAALYVIDEPTFDQLIRNAKRRLQNSISEFVWGEEGIIGQIAQWMDATMSEKYPEKHETLPAGYESPTQIANTEFGKAVMADDSLQNLVNKAAYGAMDLAALERAVGSIPGLAQVEDYIELSNLGEDAAAFVANDILRYLDMKLA